MLTITGCGKKLTTFSLEDVLNVTVDGSVNGVASINIARSSKNFHAITAQMYPDGYTDLDYAQYEILLYEGIELSVEGNTENVSNGDEITISAVYSEENFKNNGLVMNPTNFTYIVSGLKNDGENLSAGEETETEKAPLEKVDVFEGIEVRFEGTSPYLKASFAGGNYSGYINYNLNKTTALKNGDTVTLTATPNDRLLTDKNAEPITLTNEYIVEGFPEYVSDILAYDLTSVNETLAANAEKKVDDDYVVGKSEYSLMFMGYERGNLIEYWVTDSTELKLAAQYYFTPKVISGSEPSDWNNANGAYANFLLNIYAYEITATKKEQNRRSDTTDGYAQGATETFTLYMMSDVTNLRDTGDGTLDFENSEFYTNFYRNPDWLNSADEVFALFEVDYAENYNIEKIK
jgi:hypothetical protein